MNNYSVAKIIVKEKKNTREIMRKKSVSFLLRYFPILALIPEKKSDFHQSFIKYQDDFTLLWHFVEKLKRMKRIVRALSPNFFSVDTPWNFFACFVRVKLLWIVNFFDHLVDL